MTKQPRRHHFVTRAYMRRFSEDGEHVYTVFKKGRSGFIPPKPTSVENLCLENDFYTILDPDMKKNTRVEEILARYEDTIKRELFDYIPVDLLHPFQENAPILTKRQKLRLCDAIAMQIARGKATRDYGSSVIEQLYSDALSKLKSKHKDTPNILRELDIIAKDRERLTINALVEGSLIELIKGPRNSLIISNLRERVCFIFINLTGIDFMTSDEPVLVCDSTGGKNGIFNCPLGNWNSVVYYPLDARHMAALYTREYCGGISADECRIVTLGEKDLAFIDAVNTAQYLQCNRCVIAKRKESLYRLPHITSNSNL